MPVRSLFAPLLPLLSEGQEDAESSGNEKPYVSLEDDLPASPLPILDMPRTYICPGEKHAIPRSIHLARLAAFFPKCRNCEHRHDTGQLPRSVVGRLEKSAHRIVVSSPFVTDGVRAAYLNQFTQKTAGQIAAAVADRLWEDRPLVGQIERDADKIVESNRRLSGPSIVIGQDSRSSSAMISVGVSASLRRMGCEVVDIGCVSGPCLTFAVEHLQSAAGIYVTGSGCPEAWTGLDLVGQGGVPWSIDQTLADIERRSQSPISRPTRQGGTQRFFDASLPYRASLLKHFQELRPLKVVCASSEGTVLDALVTLCDGLPCELIPVQKDSRKRDAADEDQRSRSMVAAAVKDFSAEYGVLIGDEGGELRMFDRNGRPFAEAELLRRLLELQPVRSVVVGQGADDDSHAVLKSTKTEVIESPGSAESIASTMQAGAATMGIQAGGRLWFRDPFPRCDAAVTLGRLLQSFSRDA